MINFRKRFWNKLGQATPAAPLTLSGSPPNFIASTYYPTIEVGFGSTNMELINRASSLLNIAIFYSSLGKLDMATLKSNSFSQSPAQASSEDLKKLMIIAKDFFTNFYNSGNSFSKLTPEQITYRIAQVKNNSSLNSLPSTNGTQLGTKISGDLKEMLLGLLNQLK